MDIIDNLIFATTQSELISGEYISSSHYELTFESLELVETQHGGSVAPVYNYLLEDKIAYASIFDHCVIESAIRQHWYDINGNVLSNGTSATDGNNFQYRYDNALTVSNFTASSTYHMFYAFLLENTRIVQIFEKVIEKYVYDEELGVAPFEVRQWLLNTEGLFFRDGGCRPDNITSAIRPDAYKSRKNAYYRMFGTDLAIGDVDKGTGANMAYYKAKTSNQQFVVLFEEYLTEVYYAYSHSRSTCCHSVDLNNLRELAIEIKEVLACRRGGRPGGDVNAYASTSLAREEFSSVLMMSWLALIISDNTSIVEFLGCQSSNIGDRLQRIGTKVGITAHAQSQALFEMAGPAANILALIETGTYLENISNIQTMISSLNEPGDPTPDGELMSSFLILINNWEKATGHKLKVQESKHAHHHEEVEVQTVAVKKVAKAFLN